jgi:uncharacterized protein
MEEQEIKLWRREKFLVLTWEALGNCLARIKADIDRSGFVPTTIIGIARGGLVLSSYLANQYGLRDMQAISIVRNSSETRYSDRKVPRLQWAAPDTSLEGKRVILADDIVGDGGTLRFALGLLKERGASEVRTAVIVKNENSPIEPDYRAIQVGDWIVFPWEPPLEPGAKSELVTT